MKKLSLDRRCLIQLPKIKLAKLLIIFVLTCLSCNTAFANVYVYGYYKPFYVNGYLVELSSGTTELQNSEEYNPDLFCQNRGNGYVLPSVGQYNIAYKGKEHMTNNNDTVNNASYSLRRVGSLVSEWGPSPYKYAGSGWVNGTYWTAEIANRFNRHNILLFDTSKGGGYIQNENTSDFFSAACVRTIN